jgi:hypothetical protein
VVPAEGWHMKERKKILIIEFYTYMSCRAQDCKTWVILKDIWQNVSFDLVSLLGSWQDSGKTVG